MEENRLAQDEMPENPITRKNIQRLLSYLTGKYKLLLMVALVGIAMACITSALSSVFVEKLINDYIQPLVEVVDNSDKAAVSFSGLATWIAIVAVVYAFGVLAGLLADQIMTVISNNVLHNVRNDMFKHMQKLPLSFFDMHSFGEVMSHYTNDVDALESLVSRGITTAFSSSITVIANVCFMIYLSWQMTIPVLVCVCGLIFIIGRIGGKSAKYFIKQQESIGDVDGYIEEIISGQKVVKVFTYETRAKSTFDKKNDELRENATKASVFSNILMPLTDSVGTLLYVFVALIGGFLAIECGIKSISLSVVIAFLPMTKAIVEPLTSMTSMISNISMAMAGASRVFTLLDETAEVDEGTVTLVHCKKIDDELIEVSDAEAMARRYSNDYVWAWKCPQNNGSNLYVELRGDIELVDVDFSYDGKKQVLYDLSLYAEPGEKIALVGATGAGKTTITNLINRFYDISNGRIRYDFVNTQSIKKADLRRSMGIVLQETNLFTGTVMDNIRYGNLKASDEECIRAAKLANAHDFISKLPQGYNTVLTSNGSELSQGQRQLVAIARAAVADPPVMIMDEATSSIDTRTEALVQQGMDALMEGRTVFVIAHRLSTVKNSDAIMVMENGQIIECGDHDYLIDLQGKYYQLYTGAFELE